MDSDEEDMIEQPSLPQVFDVNQAPQNDAGMSYIPETFANMSSEMQLQPPLGFQNYYPPNPIGGSLFNASPSKNNAKSEEQESAEHVRQKRLCEYHKKAAFDITRAMI